MGFVFAMQSTTKLEVFLTLYVQYVMRGVIPDDISSISAILSFTRCDSMFNVKND